MFRRLLLMPAVAALLIGIAPRVYAQDDQGAPAHVSFVEGSATLERDGRPENAPLNMPLLSGDRLRTSSGRVEVLFADGSTLHLDASTTVDFESDELLRLTEGRVRLSLPGSSREVSYRVDSPAGSVRIVQPGDYRIALLPGPPASAAGENELQLELAVTRGAADIFTDQGSTSVRDGERAYASAGLAPSYSYAYNSASLDEFDRWSETRRDVRLGVSAQYLPSDIQSYAPVLDEYGSWDYMQAYGYVWYPRVAVGWRPYSYGRWVSYPRYGWTWVGADIFSWPTHHYGRWGFRAGAWFWIPARHWAPAYVSWAYAPGYVSWCPLGFDNRPVIAIGFNVGPRYYSPWRAWTAIPAAHFGHGYVHSRVVAFDRLDARQRPSFVERSTAPVVRDVALLRGTAPIRWAGVRTGSAGERRGVTPGVARGASADPGRGVRAGAPAAGVARTPLPAGRADTRDNYFTRGGDAGEHAVPRSGATQPFPAPSRQPRDMRGVPPLRAGGRAVPSAGAAVTGDAGAGHQQQAMPRRPGATIYGPGRGTERRSDSGGAIAPRIDPAGPQRRAAPMGDPSRAPMYGRPNYGSAPSPAPSAAPRTPPGVTPYSSDRAIPRSGGRGFGQPGPRAQDPIVREPMRREPTSGAPVMREPGRREPAGGAPVMREPVRREPAAPAPVMREPARRESAAPPPPPPQRSAPAARPSGGSHGREQAVPRRGGRGGTT